MAVLRTIRHRDYILDDAMGCGSELGGINFDTVSRLSGSMHSWEHAEGLELVGLEAHGTPQV